jgi:hypothetical protein
MPIKHVLNVAEESDEGWANSSAPFRPAKSQVCVNEKGESVGNGLFANVDFEPGQLVANIRRPIVGSLDTERLHDTCANCYVWTEGASTGTRTYVPEGTKVSKCAGCQRFRYCSKVRVLALIPFIAC